MTRTLQYTITANMANKTILEFLTGKGISRQTIIALKKQPESILVNQVWVHVTHRLCPGDLLTITLKEDCSSAKIPPVCLPLHVLYEDEDILVINKQADMPIHPSLHNYDNTLANAVAYYYESRHIPFVFRCIKRLDRDTTGLTVIAKNQISASILSEQMTRREITREYLAITDGLVTPSEGIIAAPIARKDGSTIERCVDFTNGERAITHYEVQQYHSSHKFSLLRLWLETGRTHQIRVHMSYLGHPLLGDFLYHPPTGKETEPKISRQALHAWRLTITHPITGKLLTFQAPVPEDMLQLLESTV